MATAIVSPKARPKPRIIAPIMPELAAGNSTRQMVSQRVAPRAMEALRNSGGTVSKTSRLIAEMVGTIMIARITPAISILGPKGWVLNKGNQAKF